MALENLRQTRQGNDVFDQFRHRVAVRLIAKDILIIDVVGSIQSPGRPQALGQLRIIRQLANITLICLVFQKIKISELMLRDYVDHLLY